MEAQLESDDDQFGPLAGAYEKELESSEDNSGPMATSCMSQIGYEKVEKEETKI